MACVHSEYCLLYPIFQMQSVLQIWKTKYCYLDPQKCIRYEGFRKGVPPPNNMLPNGEHLKYSVSDK